MFFIFLLLKLYNKTNLPAMLKLYTAAAVV